MTTWIDGHLDLAYCAVTGRDLTGPYPPPDGGCVTLPELRRARVDICFATIFTEPVDPSDAPHADAAAYHIGDVLTAEARARQQLHTYEDLERRGELRIIRTRDDLDTATIHPAVVLLMEGADPIRDPARLNTWFERGLRIVGLAWARGTVFAGGNGRPAGLSDPGRAMIGAIDRLNMIHDASHLADDALDELLDLARGPVIASHSNCRALLDPDNQRHLTDRHITAIAERGGVIGLNLYAPFVGRDGRPDIDRAIDHLEHIVQLTRRHDCVGLGSDMDGGFPADRLLADLTRPSELPRLADRLSDRGWSDDQIARFRHDNWHVFLRHHLPDATKAEAAAPRM